MNENKASLNKKNSYINQKRKIISLNFYKNHFQKFSFPKIQKLLNEQFKYNKPQEDDLNHYSHSNKKTITSLSNNNDIIKANNVFTTKKPLIDKNEIRKIIKNNKLKKEKFSATAFEFGKKIKSIGKNSLDFNKNDFPEIGSNANKSSFFISSYKTKNQIFRRQSLPQKQNLFSPSNSSKFIYKSSNRIQSSKFNGKSVEDSVNQKCNYLILKYNEKEKSKKEKNFKINVNNIVKSINTLLLPHDQTFEILEKLINDRIKNKESSKHLDEKLINYESELSKNKILQIIFMDVIKKIYKQILKKGYKYNVLSNKNEIKKEYFNKIKNVKEILTLVKNEKEKELLYKCKTNSPNIIKTKKNFITIKLTSHKKLNNPNLFEKEENNNLTSNENKIKIKKNKSCDDVIFHFYNFNEASNEIQKQNFLKDQLINQFNYNYLISTSLSNDFFRKIEHKNNFVKKYILQKKTKNEKNIKEKNDILSNSNLSTNNKINSNYINNKFGTEKETYKTLKLHTYENKNKLNINLQNNLIEKNNKKYNHSDNNNDNKNNENDKLNNKRYENDSDDRNNSFNNNKNEIISNHNNKNHFFINNKNVNIQEKIYFQNKYQLAENNNKKYNKNEDIINYIQCNNKSQAYLQLFFKNNSINDNNGKTDSFTKRKFIKRKTKKEIALKEFIQKEKEEYDKIEDKKPEIKKEEIKDSLWEGKFNKFKNYVQKLKEMSNDEFMKDTFKFLKKEE